MSLSFDSSLFTSFFLKRGETLFAWRGEGFLAFLGETLNYLLAKD